MDHLLDPGDDPVQVLHRCLEELVAREGLEEPQGEAAGVARAGPAGLGEDRLDLVPDERDGQHRARVGGRGEEAREAPLDELALVVTHPHRDEVGVGDPVDREDRVRLADREAGPGGLLLPGSPPEWRDRLGGRVGPEHAQPGAGGCGDGRGTVRGDLDGVVPDPDEGEVVVDEPPEELRGRAAGLRRPRGAARLEVVGQREGALPHRPPVLDGGGDRVDDLAHPLLDQREVAAIGELDAHPRLLDDVLSGLVLLPGVPVEDLEQAPSGVPPDDEERVEEEGDPDPLVRELAEHRVDEEGPVRRDDVEHPVDGPDDRLPRSARRRELAMCDPEVGERNGATTHELCDVTV